jgi:hypothetical protein
MRKKKGRGGLASVLKRNKERFITKRGNCREAKWQGRRRQGWRGQQREQGNTLKREGKGAT